MGEFSRRVVLGGIAGAAALTALPSVARAQGAMRAGRLTTEHVVNPLGIDVSTPRFGWRLDAPGTGRGQSAYRITVSTKPNSIIWDSGKVFSPEQTARAYAGPPLRARTRYHWSVQVWDEKDQPGPASEGAWFETGVGTWAASWIGSGIEVPRPVRVLPPRQYTPVRLEPGHTLGQTFKSESRLRAVTVLLGVGGAAGCVMTLYQDGKPVGRTEVKGLAPDRYGHASGRLDFPAPVDAGEYYLELTEPRGDVSWMGLPYEAYPDGTAIADGEVRPGDRWLCGIPPVPPKNPLLRTEFDLPATIAEARLYVAGLGHAITHVNGHRVGDELAPSSTDFPTRVLYDTHDVTTLLRKGRNALGIALGRGFYATRAPDTDGSNLQPWVAEPTAIAQLEVTLADGREITIGTGPDWRLTDGPTTSDGVYAGESYDARRAQELDGWSAPGFRETGWRPATVVRGPGGRLEANAVEPVRAGGVITPKKVTTPTKGVRLYDFGVVLAGWVELRGRLPRGAGVRVLHSEKLGPSGRIETGTPGGNDNPMVDGRQQVDEYTASGRGEETWRPSFTYKGFRYVEVSGTSQDLGLVAIPLHNDVTDTMDLRLVDPVLQWIADAFHQTARNGLRGQLEVAAMYQKLGWTSATFRAVQPLLYQFGVAAVFGKWLDDIRLSQAPDGEIPLIAPMGAVAGGGLVTPSSTGIYPYLVRRYCLVYGDKTVPEKHFPAVRKYVEWLLGRLENDITDDQFGDWYPPNPGDDPAAPEGGKLVGTAYVIRTLRDATALAELVGDTEQARTWRDRTERMVRRFNEVFLDAHNGVYRTDVDAGYRQTSNAVPLAFDLVPAEHVDRVAANLAKHVESLNRHLDTGALGVGALPYALSDHGRADLAHAVLSQRDYPSYGYLRDLGATTFWESWEASSRGHNDPTLSGPVSWLAERVAGVEPLEPGWARFRVAPRAFGPLPSASVELDTVRGRVAVSWRCDGGSLVLDVVVPVNATAELTLPDGERRELGSGRHRVVTKLP